MKQLLSIFIFICTISLSACGGGGGSTANPAAQDLTTESAPDTDTASEADTAADSDSSATETDADTGSEATVNETSSEADTSPEMDTDSDSESTATDTSSNTEDTTPIVENTTINLQRSVPRRQSVNTEDTVVKASKSAEILVPEGFNLTSEQRFRISIDHPHQGSDTYLSVCKDFTVQENGDVDIDYGSCIIRTSIREQQYQAEVTVTNELQQLAAALWFLDETQDPVLVTWQLGDVE